MIIWWITSDDRVVKEFYSFPETHVEDILLVHDGMVFQTLEFYESVRTLAQLWFIIDSPFSEFLEGVV
jgi:hypothetical protein